MHHAAAENFQPILTFAKADFAPVAPALNVDFERGFGERKERRPETHLHLVDLEEGFAEFLENPFEMSEMGALVDHQSFHLMKHRRVGLVAVAAISPSRNDH